MGTAAIVTARNESGKSERSRMGFARQKLAGLRLELGSWEAVATELKPHYAASKGLWWKVANGQSTNKDAVQAVFDYYGFEKRCVSYWRPCLSDDTRRAVSAVRKPGETVDACLLRLASDNR